MPTPDITEPDAGTGTGSGSSSADWHECRITLPAAHNWLVLDLAVEQPETWAWSVAEEHFPAAAVASVVPAASATSPADVLVEWREAFAADVLWYWTVAARQKALCASLLTPQGGGVAAFYCVRELAGIPSASLRLDVLRAEAEQAEGPYFRPPEVTEVELPLGSALRVHRLEPTDPEADSGTVVEGVAHYVLPRAYPTALECRLLWGAPGLGEELGKMADELAESVRLV
ncbi:hypothetical protein ACH4UV_29975 [Streptomyces sp. NPDC020802]|uniref:hypothetical protein n=1 Tax=Streptomyces sp. NPDC020802 TaxID=3365094 RepID=UPI0037B54249